MLRKLLPFILLCFLIPQFIYADNEGWTYLDNITDQALILTKQEKYTEAKKMLEHFAGQFIKTQPQEKDYTMNDLRVITISTDEAMKALNSVSLNHDERVRKVTQLRLAMDALQSEHQPLWKEMEKTVLGSFADMKEAALEDDEESFKIHFNKFTMAVDTIYPSLVIDLDPDDISRLDSHIRFLESYDRVSAENKENHLKVMEKDMFKLFGKTITDEFDPSLVWVMLTTGSIILIVLLYVAFKKYTAERISTIKYSGRL